MVSLNAATTTITTNPVESALTALCTFSLLIDCQNASNHMAHELSHFGFTHFGFSSFSRFDLKLIGCSNECRYFQSKWMILACISILLHIVALQQKGASNTQTLKTWWNKSIKSVSVYNDNFIAYTDTRAYHNKKVQKLTEPQMQTKSIECQMTVRKRANGGKCQTKWKTKPEDTKTRIISIDVDDIMLPITRLINQSVANYEKFI